MGEQTVSGTFKLEYKNSNGRHDFIDAHYRIVDKRGRVLRTGKTNEDGKTESATIKKGEPIYIELRDLSTNTWESASPRKKWVTHQLNQDKALLFWFPTAIFKLS